MKTKIVMIFGLWMMFSCQTQQNLDEPKDESENALSFEKNDEDEYDIIVLDPQYESYLRSIAKPMNFYSEEYYKNKNQQYVSEWNYRHSQPFHYDPDFYTLRIDYDFNTDYGLKLEYKLYNFFQFINWKYKVNLGFGR